MAEREVRVVAPSRLHFGLRSFGAATTGRGFGGLGVMLDQPGTRLRVRAASDWQVVGPAEWHPAERDEIQLRMTRAAMALDDAGGTAGLPSVRVEVEQSPRLHTGLGSGTQLSLAVAVALAAHERRGLPDLTALAQRLGRGKRSAIGLYGFFHGGLIVDGGRRDDEPLAPLLLQLPMPAEWRWLVFLSRRDRGLSGSPEAAAFADQLPEVECSRTAEMARRLVQELLPAAVTGHIAEFGEALYHYGREAGLCYVGQQQGAYRDERTTRLVEALRREGILGVGQSSWGPAVFALVPGADEAARRLAGRQAWVDANEEEVLVASTSSGATVEVDGVVRPASAWLTTRPRDSAGVPPARVAEPRIDLERQPTLFPYGGEAYDLAAFERRLAPLGEPQRRLHAVHVAGTKGKGSTVAIIESLLRAAGLPTALYTSPHLRQVGERFRFAGRCWTAEEFAAQQQRLLDAAPLSIRPTLADGTYFRTLFEYHTALAFWSFADRQQTLALSDGRAPPLVSILETGLGGRLDCTNVVTPRVAVITTIGVDHAPLLGDSVPAIAAEKCGIIKPGVPVVVAAQTPADEADVLTVATRVAAERRASVVLAWETCPLSGGPASPRGQEFTARLPSGDSVRGTLRLLGRHQLVNLQAAICAADLFLQTLGRRLTPAETAAGAAAVDWPGRLELLPPRDGRGPLVLDGAHCPLSARALGAALVDLQSAPDTGLPALPAPYTLLWGMQGDKDLSGFLRVLTAALAPNTCQEVVAFPVGGERGATPARLARVAAESGLTAIPCGSIADAVAHAVASGGWVVATGSLYALATIREEWEVRSQG